MCGLYLYETGCVDGRMNGPECERKDMRLQESEVHMSVLFYENLQVKVCPDLIGNLSEFRDMF
jgi:hypothetical protein